MERKALGKGLSALIPEKAKTLDVGPNDAVIQLDADKIQYNKYQPREEFNTERLKELVASIRERGVVQPVLVRRVGNAYELIAGERRLRAVKALGVNKIPAIVKDVKSDVDLLEIALIENIQREDLNAIEEAHAYQRLTNEFDFTQDKIAQAVGKDKATVSNTMRLLKLPQRIQDYISKGKISPGHGRALLGVDGPKQQLMLCERVISKGLSVREVENMASKGAQARPKASPGKDRNIVEIEEKLQRALGTKVRIMHSKKRGKIQIEYFSLDDLERIIKILSGKG
ncbi:MAG: ParB/RepB/Spo0J family partition protein [Candidatus Omnitrophota bacterium]